MAARLLIRLGAHDRALLVRCAIAPTASPVARAAWTAVTHAGGTGPSVLAAGLPWLACCTLHQASRLALLTLIISHLLVQLVKRTVGRGRPAPAGLAFAVGFSRVRLGVHYPSDVAAGQLLALSTGLGAVAGPLARLSPGRWRR